MTSPNLFRRTPWLATRGLAEALRTETVGGALLLAGAVVALVWANSPWGDGYDHLLETAVGPAGLDLHLPLHAWASDGLLTIFFLVAGIELKQELVTGELRDPRQAVLPVVAAACGVVVPALIFLAVTAGEPEARAGWAVPVATDIAFALAVLAVIGRNLPRALRSFLLTLAVVDDLIAITIIAFFYTDDVRLLPLLGSLALVVGVLLGARKLRRGAGLGLLLVVLGVPAWALMHASGVHATVAGVLLGFALPVVGDPAAGERVEHVLRPVSAGVAVPLFAVAASGVHLAGSVSGALHDKAALGVLVGLVLGKPIGVLGGTWLTARFTRARLDPGVTWTDVFGLSLLAGVGFTVSLLVGELAFAAGEPDRLQHVRLAVLTASLLASSLAAAVLIRRDAAYRRLGD